MATWNELFEDGKAIAVYPEREVHKFVYLLERRFDERPLRIWDLCCGAGRHTVAIAERGHDAYANDIAARGVELTEERLCELGLSARTAVADMTECPWPDATFHGVLTWDSLHHNTLSNIHAALETARASLVDGGVLMATLKSTRADSFGLGTEIEPGTFVQDSGWEAGVPHHYFDERGVRAAFAKWELLSLVEMRYDYVVRSDDHWEMNPFRYTAWGALAQK
jgi:ubiquinone/menaquinone biosynthesis C-methylase UbiE